MGFAVCLFLLVVLGALLCRLPIVACLTLVFEFCLLFAYLGGILCWFAHGVVVLGVVLCFS